MVRSRDMHISWGSLNSITDNKNKGRWVLSHKNPNGLITQMFSTQKSSLLPGKSVIHVLKSEKLQEYIVKVQVKMCQL